MALLTEEDVRRMSDNGTRGPVVVRRGELLTPGARDWLRAHRVEVVYPAGGGDPGAPDAPQYRTLFGAELNNKPEHMTHLRGNVLVFKDHPRIAFPGWIDALEAELLLARRAAADEGLAALEAELGEALDFARRCIRFDVLDEPVGPVRLCGYTAEQLREVGAIRSRKMFGEYGLYCDGIFFAVICDDQLFVKVTPAGEAAFPQLPKAPPYEGAKDYIWVEDVDDRETMTALTRLTCLELQAQPKKRRK